MKIKLFDLFLIVFIAIFLDIALKIILPLLLPENFYLKDNLRFYFSELNFLYFVIGSFLGYLFYRLQK